ncbi:unnamed protein product [Cuscuta epithymum]|uniref:Gag protein n=2 Tax=Cuscuta epithymum TaxID=186058 RepID=A0AAV0CLD2_9ASTE|nr:unnamed protein product [Cuscuta epithymum]
MSQEFSMASLTSAFPTPSISVETAVGATPTTDSSSPVITSVPLHHIQPAVSRPSSMPLHNLDPVGLSMPLQSNDPIFSSYAARPYPAGSAYSLFTSLPPQFPWTPVTPSPPPVQQPASSFFGSTFAGSPGVTRPQQDNPLFGSPMAALAQTVSHGIANVGQIVTIKLKAVEDYLTWRTQFESFLVSQGLFGIVDGSIQVPPMYTMDFNNHHIVNTDYYHWLRIDQTIHSWLFATLSRDVLTDVHDIKHSSRIWERLQSRFMSASLPRAMELKRLLSNTKKKENQSMEHYLRDIKNLADALATINSPVTDRELLQYTLSGLGPDYKFISGTISLFPESFPPDILHPRLMEAEQQVLYQRQQDNLPVQQAFGAQVGPAQHGQNGQPGAYRGRGGRGRGGRGRGARGRGRYQPHHFYPQQPHSQQGPPPSAAGGAVFPRPPNVTFGKSVMSTLNINAKSTCGTHYAYAGSSSAEGILGSVPPPVVCQICFSAGHSAIACLSRFSQQSAPALLTPTGENNDALWYPDSGASAHMTSSEGQNFGGGSASGTS